MPYNYSEQLRKSEATSDEPWIADLYKLAFLSIHHTDRMAPNSEEQLSGVDKVLWFPSGYAVRVDEKFDYYDTGNVFLEIMGDIERGYEGWVTKPTAADYIAYIIVPKQVMLLLDPRMLRRVWSRYGSAYTDLYGIVSVPNDNGRVRWTAQGVAVPVGALMGAYADSFVVRDD